MLNVVIPSELVSPLLLFTGVRTRLKFALNPDQNSGLSQYQVAPGSSAQNNTPVVGPQGPGFPTQWQPR